jgi:CRP-like cAMP-binding protein
LNSQEFFGEMDFFDSLRPATAVANENCLLLSMPKSKLEDIFISKDTLLFSSTGISGKHLRTVAYYVWRILAGVCLAGTEARPTRIIA